LKNVGFPYNQQIPQLSQLAKTIAESFCLNNCWVDLANLDSKSLSMSRFLQGEVFISSCKPEWKRVIYSIKPLQYDREGNLLWRPSIEITVRHQPDTCEWIGQFTPPTHGKYRVSATVFDHAGLPIPEDILPVEISINDGRPYLAMEKPGIPKRLSIPALGLPDGNFFRLEFYQINDNSLFELIEPIEPLVAQPESFVMFDPVTLTAHLPELQIENGGVVAADLIVRDEYFSLEYR
jgi:hypothetical protein